MVTYYVLFNVNLRSILKDTTLILGKLKCAHLASAELTTCMQPTVGKTLMLGYLSLSANLTHSIKFTESGKFGAHSGLVSN